MQIGKAARGRMSKSPFEQAGGKGPERPGMFADVKQHDNPPISWTPISCSRDGGRESYGAGIFYLLEMLIGSTGRPRTGVARYELNGLSVLDAHGGPRIHVRMRGPPHHSPRATACIRREASRGAPMREPRGRPAPGGAGRSSLGAFTWRSCTPCRPRRRG